MSTVIRKRRPVAGYIAYMVYVVDRPRLRCSSFDRTLPVGKTLVDHVRCTTLAAARSQRAIALRGEYDDTGCYVWAVEVYAVDREGHPIRTVNRRVERTDVRAERERESTLRTRRLQHAALSIHARLADRSYGVMRAEWSNVYLATAGAAVASLLTLSPEPARLAS